MISITPLASFLGGIILGFCVLFFRVIFGRVLGISGILNGLFTFGVVDQSWRVLFTLGLIFSGIFGMNKPIDVGSDLFNIVLAGFMVGFGTFMANGCTSGHGLCGIARLSRRSLIAVSTFMVTAMVTRYIRMKESFTLIEPVIDNSVSLPIEYLLPTLVGLIGVAYVTSPSINSPQMVNLTTNIYSFAIGALFGTGLILSGMNDPLKVLNFLSLPTYFLNRPDNSFAVFDPSLMIVMGAGVIPNMILNPFIEKSLDKPRLSETSRMPTLQLVTPKLVFGSMAFGIGWGLAGICPGPAIVSFSRVLHGEFEIAFWLVAYFAGSKLAGLF